VDSLQDGTGAFSEGDVPVPEGVKEKHAIPATLIAKARRIPASSAYPKGFMASSIVGANQA